jgi:hypothetical protein
MLSCNKAGRPSTMRIELSGSQESPIINPAFVIKNWGRRNVDLKIDGKKIKQGKDFRFGHRNSMEGIDLVLWIRLQSIKPVQLEFSGQD